MRLGIDFGTTRVVVAAADRGNYPVVSFEDGDGVSREWLPPLVAARDGSRRYGWQAWQVQNSPGWTVIRSLKRYFENAGPQTLVQIGSDSVPLLQILEEMAGAIGTALREASSLPAKGRERLEIILGVPANANSNQRYLTVEPFQRAGFQVLGLSNEPSAASVEYGHRNRSATSAEDVLVYDLGGGTFDASLVHIEGSMHTVVASEGVSDIGGDDFDLVLSGMVLEAASLRPEELTQAELFRLHEECRSRKESLNVNSRRVMVDLGVVREGWREITVPAAAFYEQCRPLVERTIAATHALGDNIDTLYVTGGGSELPAVARILREVFGRRVKRSAYTRSATAIGLAIQAESLATYTLREQFTRHFGVWRELQAGKEICFDVLFEKGTPLPAAGEASIEAVRTYQARHNIGHFRFLECSHLTSDRKPAGDIAMWDEIRFPFDPSSRDANLPSLPVSQSPSTESQTIQERYACTSSGSVEVQIHNLSAQYSRDYRLGRWASANETVVPGRKRRCRTGGA
ncbi:MAG: Hsp70 family protein [Bryobacteraceae bacterium]